VAFNRNFFKFALGFVTLVLFSLLGLLVTNYYEVVNEDDGVDDTARVEINR